MTTTLTSLRSRLGAAALAFAVLSTAGTAFAAQTSTAQPANAQATHVAASTTQATKPAVHKTMTTSKATQCSDQAHTKGLTGAKYASFVQSCSSKS